jgi:hypothetical protein
MMSFYRWPPLCRPRTRSALRFRWCCTIKPNGLCGLRFLHPLQAVPPALISVAERARRLFASVADLKSHVPSRNDESRQFGEVGALNALTAPDCEALCKSSANCFRAMLSERVDLRCSAFTTDQNPTAII